LIECRKEGIAKKLVPSGFGAVELLNNVEKGIFMVEGRNQTTNENQPFLRR